MQKVEGEWYVIPSSKSRLCNSGLQVNVRMNVPPSGLYQMASSMWMCRVNVLMPLSNEPSWMVNVCRKLMYKSQNTEMQMKHYTPTAEWAGKRRHLQASRNQQRGNGLVCSNAEPTKCIWTSENEAETQIVPINKDDPRCGSVTILNSRWGKNSNNKSYNA